jgi:hypothetical protein
MIKLQKNEYIYLDSFSSIIFLVICGNFSGKRSISVSTKSPCIVSSSLEPFEQPQQNFCAKNFLAISRSTSFEAKPLIIVTNLLPFRFSFAIMTLVGTFSFLAFGWPLPPRFW